MNKNIKYFVIDVDGTMTDSGIYYDIYGNELKKFNTKDAAAFFALHQVGIKIIVLTGRECKATTRRMKELKVDYLFQNVKNKKQFLEKFMKENRINKEEIGYIGDDLNDLSAMLLTGYIACPKNACKEIQKISQYVSKKNGGDGAVRDIIETYLSYEDLWSNIVLKNYCIGI